MSYQDFTTFTTVDGAVRFSCAANVITIANLDNDEAYYVYKDFTVGYFSADFESFFRLRFTLGTGAESIYLAAYANGVGAISALVAASGDALWLAWDNGQLSIGESNGGSVASSVVTTLSLDTQYFIRLARDENVGTFGTLYVYVYADEQMTDLVVASSLALSKKTDFRYLYAASGKSTGGGSTALSGTISYLDLTANPFTRKRIREDFREVLNAPGDSPILDVGFFTTAEINQWIIDAVVDLAVRGQCDQDTDSVSTTNAVRTFAFSGHTVSYVEYSALGIPQISETQLGHDVTGGTAPRGWYMVGSGLVGIEPLPDASYTLTLYVADNGGTAMTADYDIPLIPPAFRQLIFLNLLVCGLMKLQQGQTAFIFYNLYIQEIAETMSICQAQNVESFEDKKMPDYISVK
jgi:hypothetical protein